MIEFILKMACPLYVIFMSVLLLTGKVKFVFANEKEPEKMYTIDEIRAQHNLEPLNMGRPLTIPPPPRPKVKDVILLTAEDANSFMEYIRHDMKELQNRGYTIDDVQYQTNGSLYTALILYTR